MAIGSARYQLVQQLSRLAVSSALRNDHAGDVAARPGEAGD